MAKKTNNKKQLFEIDNSKPNDTSKWYQKHLDCAASVCKKNPKKHIFDKLVKAYSGSHEFNLKDQWFKGMVSKYNTEDKSILLAGQKLLAIEIPDLTPEEKLDILRATTQKELYKAIGINI